MITVAEFIIKNGIEKLVNRQITKDGKNRTLVVSDRDLRFHDLNNKTWDVKYDNTPEKRKEFFDEFHKEGNYRFYAIAEDGGCVWIYGCDLIEDIETEENVIYFLESKGLKGVPVSAQDYSMNESCLKVYSTHFFKNLTILSKQCTGFYRYKYFENDSTAKMGSLVSVS